MPIAHRKCRPAGTRSLSGSPAQASRPGLLRFGSPGLLLTCTLFLVALAAAAQAPRPTTDLKPTVILISIDGFRCDFLEKYSAPNLHNLALSGVRAESMQPSFPTYTFPNHYTLVTGLYPAHHGIVANEMYDPSFDATFVYKEPQAKEGRWWGGEPIWVTADRQGQKTATLYWPGSAAPIKGMWPDYWEPFDAKVTPEQRADEILTWLDQPAEQRPTFLALYFDQVDHEGHEGGPDSPQVSMRSGTWMQPSAGCWTAWASAGSKTGSTSSWFPITA